MQNTVSYIEVDCYMTPYPSHIMDLCASSQLNEVPVDYIDVPIRPERKSKLVELKRLVLRHMYFETLTLL